MFRFKIVNFLLVVSMLLGTVVYVLNCYCGNQMLFYLTVPVVLFLPFLLIKTKYQLGDREMLWYYLFIFLAVFLGYVLKLYDIISWFDLLVHFLSGIFVFRLGLFVFKRSGGQIENFRLMILFAFLMAMASASMWEIFEYSCDSFLGLNMQHSLETGVQDTMGDMIVAFGGAILSVIFCSISKKCDKIEV